MSVAPGDPGEERRRACELLTRVRDWTATALGKSGASMPMLPPGAIHTGDDAFRLLWALEPVADELDALAAGPQLRKVVDAATAAARSATEDVRPAEDDLLDVGRRAGQVLDGWAAAGLGDPVEAAEETIRAAAGPAA